MSEVIYEIEDGIAKITLNRPEKRNALNDKIIEEIKKALSKAESDESAKVVLLTGAGKDFCSGADLSSLQKIAESDIIENLADAEKLMELFIRLRSSRLPIVAAVRGKALAGGCGLATACDIILAAKSARFGYPEVKIGFVPAMVTAILRRNVSEKRAFELITQGFEISAEEAKEIGLVNKVFEDKNFEKEVTNYISVYKTVSQSAVSLSKKLLYQIDTIELNSALRIGTEVNTIARFTRDCREGIQRFLSK